MAMPEAPMNEDGQPVLRKNKVGSPGEVRSVQAKAKP